MPYPAFLAGVHASTAAGATVRQHVPNWIEADGGSRDVASFQVAMTSVPPKTQRPFM